MLIPEPAQLTLLRRIGNLPFLATESPFKGQSNLSQSGRLAQLVERQPYKLNVVGSIPAAPTIFPARLYLQLDAVFPARRSGPDFSLDVVAPARRSGPYLPLGAQAQVSRSALYLPLGAQAR